MSKLRKKIKMSHLEFARDRSQGSYCPSEVARKCFPNEWRGRMGLVREVADELVVEGCLVVMQNGKAIKKTAVQAKGPIRLKRR